MKKVIIFLLSILLLIIPNNIRALTEDQVRKAITNYAYYIYNEKKNDISYINPSEVNQDRIFLGYKTQNNTYAMDGKGHYVTEADAITTSVNGLPTVLDNIGIVTSYHKYGDRWNGYLDMNLTLQFYKNKNSIPSGF